jgi:hypothetical protein
MIEAMRDHQTNLPDRSPKSLGHPVGEEDCPAAAVPPSRSCPAPAHTAWIKSPGVSHATSKAAINSARNAWSRSPRIRADDHRHAGQEKDVWVHAAKDMTVLSIS